MHNVNYAPIKKEPIAKFYYKGHHSHPVRRTVIVIHSTVSSLTGYELREGSEVRSLREAPVKTYKKAKIAKERQVRHKKKTDSSTLVRTQMFDLIKAGP